MCLKAYPPSDVVVKNHLQPNPQDTDDMLYFKYATFLIEMFDEALSHIRAFDNCSHEVLAKKWHDWLGVKRDSLDPGENRTTFYKKVVAAAKKVIQLVPPLHLSTHRVS